jgi:hypothetical protein
MSINKNRSLIIPLRMMKHIIYTERANFHIDLIRDPAHYCPKDVSFHIFEIWINKLENMNGEQFDKMLDVIAGKSKNHIYCDAIRFKNSL